VARAKIQWKIIYILTINRKNLINQASSLKKMLLSLEKVVDRLRFVVFHWNKGINFSKIKKNISESLLVLLV
jgi:hypothetical protein